MKTLEQLYNETYTNYYGVFDNKGNFVEGKGIWSNKIVKECEKALKGYIRKNRKNNIKIRVLWNNKRNEISGIYIK